MRGSIKKCSWGQQHTHGRSLKEQSNVNQSLNIPAMSEETLLRTKYCARCYEGWQTFLVMKANAKEKFNHKTKDKQLLINDSIVRMEDKQLLIVIILFVIGICEAWVEHIVSFSPLKLSPQETAVITPIAELSELKLWDLSRLNSHIAFKRCDRNLDPNLCELVSSQTWLVGGRKQHQFCLGWQGRAA